MLRQVSIVFFSNSWLVLKHTYITRMQKKMFRQIIIKLIAAIETHNSVLSRLLVSIISKPVTVVCFLHHLNEFLYTVGRNTVALDEGVKQPFDCFIV